MIISSNFAEDHGSVSEPGPGRWLQWEHRLVWSACVDAGMI
jgi:hypothetical protein